ncbi:tRNA pseudouridine synthase A [Nymphon striatum]|nr:tRNA pseudouridine synthase A [Nymphon striatum]
MDKDWEPFRLFEALNFHLKPAPVAISACVRVSEDWHARFSALERRYLFRLVSRRAPLVLESGKIWQVRQKLDLAAMQEGANRLLGPPMRTLDALDIEQIERNDGAQELRFHVRARSFLHNQVRSFVGTLERVGAGSWSPDDVTAALEAKDRQRCGPVCPPQGLYLAQVGYPEDPFA